MKEKKQRTEKNSRGTKNSIIIIALFTFLIIAASFVIGNFDSLMGEESSTTSKVNVVESAVYRDDEEELFLSSQSGSSSGFPVSFASNSIKDAAVVDSSIFVLNRDMLTCITSSGTIKYSKVLNFVDPIIKTSDKYCIAFDRQGSKYMIFNRKNLVSSGESENEAQIITAAIQNDGSYVIISRKSGSTSMLTYYGKDGKKRYQWLCANEHIVAVDVSDNGKNIACAAINSKSGDLYTRIYYFDIDESKNNKNYKIKTAAAMDVFFVSGNKIIAVCNNQRVMVDCRNKDTEPVTVKFSSSVIARSSDKNGNTAVIRKKIDSFSQYELAMYDSKNNFVYSSDIDDDVLDVVCDKMKVYVLHKNKIQAYSSSGKASDEIELDSSSVGIAIGSGRLYHYSQGYLYK